MSRGTGSPEVRRDGGKPRRRRILLAKPGLDGHDRGLKVVARLLRDAGLEVIYTGMRQTPAAIAHAALQEDVQVVGLSVLSGAHLRLTGAVIDELRREGMSDVPVIVGGTIPQADIRRLQALGVSAVFGVTSTFAEIRTWFEENT